MAETKRMSLFFISAEAGAAMAWRPAADIYRTSEGWVIKLELAGVQQEDVSVEVRGSDLFVTGVRRDRFVEEGWTHHAMEIAYSHFERIIELPEDMSLARILVEGHEGLLLVHVITGREER